MLFERITRQEAIKLIRRFNPDVQGLPEVGQERILWPFGSKVVSRQRGSRKSYFISGYAADGADVRIPLSQVRPTNLDK